VHNNEVDLTNYPPQIVRAFIQAISPMPGPTLPTILYTFGKVVIQGQKAVPVMVTKANVLKPDNVQTEVIEWDIASCLTMYDLAAELDCCIVKDMVTEKVNGLIFDILHTMQDYPGREHDDFRIAVEYLNLMDQEKDAGFIKLIKELHRLPSSETLEKCLYYDCQCREAYDDRPFWTHQARCERYHAHHLVLQHSEPCHTKLGDIPNLINFRLVSCTSSSDTSVIISNILSPYQVAVRITNELSVASFRFRLV
jgi:hypothetical protein